jgi:hypothetical protein
MFARNEEPIGNVKEDSDSETAEEIEGLAQGKEQI